MKQLIVSFALLSLLASCPAAAQKFQQEWGAARKSFVEAIATPDHADSRYLIGEQASLRLVAREGGVPLDGATVRYRVGKEMFLPERWDTLTFAHGEATIVMGTMSEPGFLACQYEYKAGGHTQRDLVKVAFEPELIRTLTPMPGDFDTFWQTALSEARRVPLEPQYTDIADATSDSLITQLVRLHVGRDKWMQGYLTRPRGRVGKCPVVLCPPGAGSQKIGPSDFFPNKGCVYLKIEIHDNDQLLPGDEYNAMRSAKCEGYMHRGMDSRDTYYYKDHIDSIQYSVVGG